uniref:ATP synthase F0 subunit 6 n=1 Tax=Oecleopsis sinicus TaxID=1308491 RepID=UPI0021B5B442|nr:ATP synthase F0 subunit 6 [Oecleopsis sinicus]UVV36478.1 ATP synthase F0 subunit 6 [Oecleopsis sinicus]
MMSNLFSSFDPSTSPLIQLNWMSMLTAMLIMPTKFWNLNSQSTMLLKKTTEFIMKEMNNITKNKQIKLLMMSMFMFILINNIMGITPYTFTATSHLVISLALSLPMWIMLMMHGWIKFTNNMFSHLLPTGTPMLLMPFMIMIETISNLIRPISLSVRLTANMIAGHLLMTLLGEINSLKTIPLIFIMKMILMMFETAISMIQAYVFTILSTLYSSEIP